MRRSINILFLFLSMVVLSSPCPAQAPNMGLKECIKKGLENNLNVRRSEYERLSAREVVVQTESMYEPSVSLSASRTDQKSSGNSAFYGSENKLYSIELGINKKLSATGGSLGLSWANEKTDTDSAFMSTFNPFYDSSLSLTYSQPLLKNFIGKNDKLTLENIGIYEQIADLSYAYNMNGLVYMVESAYYDLVFAVKNLDIKKASLDRSKRLLNINRKKMKDGLMEEVDVIATEAAVTIQDAAIMLAEDSVRTAKENLRRIIGISKVSDCDFMIDINTDFKHTDVELAAVYNKALANRSDLRIMELSLEAGEIDEKIKKNQRLPELRLDTSYSLADTSEDLSGNYDTLASGDYPTWYAGLTLNLFPLSRRTGSELKQAGYANDLSAAEFEDKKEEIRVECAQTVRNFNTYAKYVNAATRSLELQRRKLHLEEIKFNQGRSSIQWVLSYQDDLSNSEVEYYRALTDYYKAQSRLVNVMGGETK